MKRLMSRMACLSLVAVLYGVVASCQHAGGAPSEGLPDWREGRGAPRAPEARLSVQPTGLISRISPVPVYNKTTSVEGFVTFSVGPGASGSGVQSSYTVVLGSVSAAGGAAPPSEGGSGGSSASAERASFTPRFTTEPVVEVASGVAYLRGRWPMPRTTRRIGTTVNTVNEDGTAVDGSGGGGGGGGGAEGSASASSSTAAAETTYRGGVVVHTEAGVDFVFFFKAGVPLANDKVSVTLNDGPKTVVVLSAGEYLELTGAPGGVWGSIAPKKISEGGSARAVEVMKEVREAAKSAGYEEASLPPVLNLVPPS